MENVLYTLDYRVISGDVGLPQNSFLTSEFAPHGKNFLFLMLVINLADAFHALL